MTNNKPITSRLADALRLGIAFMEGFEDDEMQETVTDDLKTMRDALAAYEATPSLGCYRALWEIDIEASNPREAAELALAIHRDPTSIATFFSVIAPDGTVTHHDLEEGDHPELAHALPPVQQAMLDALRSAEAYAELGLNSGSPSHMEAALSDILGAVRAGIAAAESDTPVSGGGLPSVPLSAPAMLAALRRVAEDFDDTGCEDCGVISLDTLAAVLHALQAAGVPVEIETK